jgi:tetratricopeptide (TPR) repeat protein
MQRMSRCVVAALSLAIAVPLFANTTCVVPPDVQVRFRSEPAAQIQADTGNWFADRKEYACAARSFAAASKIAPTSSAYKYLWGLSLSSAGQDTEALAPLRAATSLDPNDIRPHLALAAALEKLKQPGDAEAEWRKALAIDADSREALEGLSQDLLDRKDFSSVVQLLNKPTEGRQRSAVQSLDLGIAYSGLAQFDDAVRVLREGLNTDSDSLPLADELAMTLMFQGRAEEAFPVFELALTKHPDDWPTQLLYLRALMTNHSNKAPELAQKLLASHPKEWELLYLNAQLAAQEGNTEQTVELCAQSVRLNPNNAQSQRLLGSALAKQGKLQEAKEHLQKSIELGNGEPEVHYELARVLLGLGDSAKSHDEMSIFQKLKNSQSEKTQAAGKAEEADQAAKDGDAQKAAMLYREALQSDPNEPLLYYKLAKALEKTNDVAGEEAALQRAVTLNPQLPEAQNQLGYLAVHQGKSAEAESHFRAAVEASPSYAVAWVNLAATLASESRWKDAGEAVDHALAIDPDNPQARKLKEALASARSEN